MMKVPILIMMKKVLNLCTFFLFLNEKQKKANIFKDYINIYFNYAKIINWCNHLSIEISPSFKNHFSTEGYFKTNKSPIN